jgi:hypothetical protein
MKETSPSPVHQHSTAHQFAPALSSCDDDDFESSARARFSLDDIDDPLEPTAHPHSQPKHFVSPLYRQILIIFGFILLWYTFSLLLSLYNKWMFAPGHLDFPFPLFVSGLHMAVQFILSGLVLWRFPRLRPKREDYLSPKSYVYALSVVSFNSG